MGLLQQPARGRSHHVASQTGGTAGVSGGGRHRHPGRGRTAPGSGRRRRERPHAPETGSGQAHPAAGADGGAGEPELERPEAGWGVAPLPGEGHPRAACPRGGHFAGLFRHLDGSGAGGDGRTPDHHRDRPRPARPGRKAPAGGGAHLTRHRPPRGCPPRAGAPGRPLRLRLPGCGQGATTSGSSTPGGSPPGPCSPFTTPSARRPPCGATSTSSAGTPTSTPSR